VDPNHIAASGGSAAGCVTACCGVINGYEDANDDLSISSRPDAMLIFNPRLDTVCEGNEWQQKRLTEIFGDPQKGHSLSPVHNVKPGNPPTLIMHGTEDQRLEVDHMLRFQTAMHNAGNRCDLKLYEGAQHGFFHYRDGDNPWFYETMQAADEFLVSLNFIEGEEQTASFKYIPIEEES
jgi:dipeptidyl aminopeptidase/acylaminoacyl peptidase